MRLILAPKIIERGDADDDGESHIGPVQRVKIRTHNDVDGYVMSTLEFAHSIKAEFFDGTERVLREERFVGKESYCIQLLRHSLPLECWEKLYG